MDYMEQTMEFLCKADNTSLYYVKLLFSFQLSQTSEESTAGKAASYAQNASHWSLLSMNMAFAPYKFEEATGMQANYLQCRTGYKVSKYRAK